MKQVVVLFSGGLDSTYVVTKIASECDKLILITYRTPGMIRAEASRKSFAQLQKLYGNKVTHTIIDISDFIHHTRGGALACLRDNVKYKHFYSWCLGCKLIMHVYTAAFCKKHNITCVTDGSSSYDLHALEQYKDVKDAIAQYYRDKGIEFLTPCYYQENVVPSRGWINAILKHLRILQDAEGVRLAELDEIGIDIGRTVLGQHRDVQPSCIPSIIFNIPRVCLKWLVKEKKENYLQYVHDMLEKADRYRCNL